MLVEVAYSSSRPPSSHRDERTLRGFGVMFSAVAVVNGKRRRRSRVLERHRRLREACDA